MTTCLIFPTREADHPKRYVQDLIRDGAIENAAGQALEPRERPGLDDIEQAKEGEGQQVGKGVEGQGGDGEVDRAARHPEAVIGRALDRGLARVDADGVDLTMTVSEVPFGESL